MRKINAAVPTDRRAERTRTALREALKDLVTERGWDSIGIQDLCERANIGRSTFYLHYPNKDALLQGGLDDLQAELRRQAHSRLVKASAHEKAALQFVYGLIAHAHEQRKLFRSLIGRRSGYVVQQRFREMVIRLIADELPVATEKISRDATVRWLAGALVELLSWWVEQKTPVSPEELTAIFKELSQSAR